MFFYGFKERMFARRWWGFGGIYMIKKEGEVVGYIGANGAGKSTTIKMMAGILTPTSGKILSFIVVVLFATLIYTAIKLAVTSIAFWGKFAQSFHLHLQDIFQEHIFWGKVALELEYVLQ